METDKILYHYVITLQTYFNETRVVTGSWNGIAWGPDRSSIFQERLAFHCKALGVTPDKILVLCWTLEKNEL